MQDIQIFTLPMPASLTEEQGRILCLAADEKKRALYRTGKARSTAEQSLAAQVLLRYAAAKEMHIPMDHVKIAYSDNGKPILLHDGWHCSVSHTEGLCVVAIARQPVGIDVEKVRPCPLRVAEKFFTPREQAQLKEAADKDSCFLEIFTKHESVVKLTGEGLRAIRDPVPASIRTETERISDSFILSVSTFTN